MPIYNKGRFKLSEIIQPQFGNNWPTAQVTTTSDITEGINLYFSNARVYSNVIALLPTLAGSGIAIQANGQISANAAVVTFGAINQFLTTSNVSEGSNLYYTNARVYSNVIALLPTLAGSGIQIQANGQINASTATVSLAGLTTSNLAEGTNLYYTNARVLSALTGNVTIGNLTATSIVIGTSTANSYTTAGNVTAGNVIATVHQGNIWVGIYTANVSESNSNLYYTNSRVYSNILALLPTLAGSGITIQANGQISANTQSVSLAGLSTTNLAEGSNLYYTNTRARTAFTAGKGISILGDGTIKSTAAGGDYNISLSGATGYTVSNVMAGITFTGSASDRFILRSLQVTNISDSNAAYVSSNVLYSGGNTAYLGNLISVPLGGMAEFISRTQIFQPGDSIYLQGFDNNYTATSNILSAYFTYETINNDISYIGIGQTLANANANVSLVTADTTDFIVESIKFVNLRPTNIPIRLYVANSTTLVPKAYLAYNMQVPAGSSLEILQSPKVLKQYDGVYARYANSSNADSIAVFTSYRKTEQTTIGFTTGSTSIGGNAIATFNTSVSEGTVLYYTIR